MTTCLRFGEGVRRRVRDGDGGREGMGVEIPDRRGIRDGGGSFFASVASDFTGAGSVAVVSPTEPGVVVQTLCS